MAVDTTTMQLQRDVERLKALSETEANRCPYRETIARAVNSTEQIKEMRGNLDELTETVMGIRVEMAKMSVLAGVSGGGGLAVVGGVIAAIAKAAGWW